jgi:hypothetical protein
MAIARYNLKISSNGNVLIALPTTSKTAGHNDWVLPSDLMTAENPADAVKKLFVQLTGREIDEVARNKHSLQYIQRVDDDKVNYRTEVVLDEQLPMSFSTSSLTRYDKSSNLRIPKYVKFKWVPEGELYYWLTRQYCRLEDIRISYFYPDNVRPAQQAL